jgi:hypothetical protein
MDHVTKYSFFEDYLASLSKGFPDPHEQTEVQKEFRELRMANDIHVCVLKFRL